METSVPCEYGVFLSIGERLVFGFQIEHLQARCEDVPRDWPSDCIGSVVGS
jgi:hypothetical protein